MRLCPSLPSCWCFSFPLGRGVFPQSRSSAMQLPLQHLLSCWGFSSLGHGVSPHSLSITAQLPLQLHTAATHTQKNYTKMIFTTQIITMVLTTHLEPYVLECEVKWALGNITMNKASRGDGIPVELFQILKDDAVTVLHKICQQI